MIACRTASIVAFSALFGAFVIAACREASAPDVPAVTSAHPTNVAPPPASVSTSSTPAPTPSTSSDAGVATTTSASTTKPPVVSFIEGTKKLEGGVCTRQMIVAARGTVKVGEESLSVGDVHFTSSPNPIEVKAPGLAVLVLQEWECEVLSRPATRTTILRAKDVPELKWANGTMKAQLMVPSSLSPDLYLGHLSGTAGVAEHEHATSTEVLIAIEAAGTFTLDGKDNRLGNKQVVTVPKGTKHAWKPDTGSKLVAIQLYAPPGPEQRFIGLAAAAADAGGLPKK